MQEYKEIPHSLYYGISKCGEVVRFPHYRLHNINKKMYLTKLKILKPSTNNSKGYSRILIQYKDKKKTESVHRLVASLFVSNPDNKQQVNHIDGDKLNNCYTNLEWVTNEENAYHACANLRTSFKYKKRKSQLSEQQVLEIADLIRSKSVLLKDIALKYNVAKTTITEIKSGRSWRHLNLFPPRPRKCEKYFKYKLRYVPTTGETQASVSDIDKLIIKTEDIRE